MIEQLPLALRRCLAAGLLVLALAGLAAVTIWPLMSRLADVQERIEQERLVLGRLLAATGDTGNVLQLEQQAKAARASGLFIEGESESIRLASLQSQLLDIIGSHKVKPRTTRNLPTRERNNLRLVGVQIQLAAPIDRLQRILLDIEGHKPVLLIESLHITSAGQANVPGDEERGMLDARLDIVGIEARQKGP